MEEVTLVYSEDLLRRAIKSFWWRTIGPAYIVATLLMIVPFGYLIYLGDYSWLTGVLGGGIFIAILFASVLYVTHYRNTIGKFRSLKGSTSILKTGIEEFEIQSPIGNSKMKWSNITELWQFKEYWLVFLSKSQFFTLPTSCLTSSIKESILNNVRAEGGKIS